MHIYLFICHSQNFIHTWNWGSNEKKESQTFPFLSTVGKHVQLNLWLIPGQMCPFRFLLRSLMQCFILLHRATEATPSSCFSSEIHSHTRLAAKPCSDHPAVTLPQRCASSALRALVKIVLTIMRAVLSSECAWRWKQVLLLMESFPWAKAAAASWRNPAGRG